jgi:hypothetical protein
MSRPPPPFSRLSVARSKWSGGVDSEVKFRTSLASFPPINMASAAHWRAWSPTNHTGSLTTDLNISYMQSGGSTLQGRRGRGSTSFFAIWYKPTNGGMHLAPPAWDGRPQTAQGNLFPVQLLSRPIRQIDDSHCLRARPEVARGILRLGGPDAISRPSLRSKRIMPL